MKRFLSMFSCLTLMGCVCFSSSKYYENEQILSITLPKGTLFTIDGYEPNSTEIKVDRSFASLKGVLSKEGFKDKEVEIKSHFTDDKWAELDYWDGSKKESSSAYSLLVPRNSTSYAAAGFYSGIYGFQYGPLGILTTPVGTVGGFVFGLGKDIYNIVYGIPSVIIGNPWYEYDKRIDLSNESLTPIPEFEKLKQDCHKKKGTFIGNNECLSCEIKKDVFASQQECGRCSNRSMYKDVLCLSECTKGFQSMDNQCLTCNEKKDYKTTKKECQKCRNRKWINGVCVLGYVDGDLGKCTPDKPLGGDDGKCYSCDDPAGILVSDCSVCPNRTMIRARCSLSKCPLEKPMRIDDTDCYSCDTLKYIPIQNKEQCKSCPNRKVTQLSRLHNIQACVLRTCPKDYPLQDLDGSCFACDDPTGISVSDCSVCPNRSLIEKKCSWTKCPKDYPVRGLFGTCMSCEEASHYLFSAIKKNYEELCLKNN